MVKKQRGITYILYFGIMIFCLSVQSSLLSGIPDSIEMRLNAEKGTGVTIEQFLQSPSNERYAFCSEQFTDLGRNDIEAKKVLVDERYLERESFKLLSGSKINKEMIGKCERVVLISREMAVKLFFTTDALGRKITLDGSEYTVIGVYNDQNFQLAKDYFWRLYIPYSSVNQWEETAIDTIEVPEQGKKENGLEKLRLELGSHYNQYEVQDYRISKLAARQGVKSLNSMLGISILYLLYKKLFYIGKEFAKDARKKMKRYYMKTYLKKYKSQILGLACLTVFVLIFILLLWRSLRFTVIVPTEYLPNENIFDISYYCHALLDKIQLHNSGVLKGSGVNYLLLLYGNILNIIIISIGASYLFYVRRKAENYHMHYKEFAGMNILLIVGMLVILIKHLNDYVITIYLMAVVLLLKKVRLESAA